MIKKSILCVFSIFTFLGLSTSVVAQCTAPHGYTGALVQVRERSGPSPFWAHAGWDPDGWPAITYGPIYYQLPPLMQAFTRIHECMHVATPTSNEIEANCRALTVMRQRGLSARDEQFIAQYHMRPELQQLPLQYGGSGRAFWNGTMSCAGHRHGRS